MDDIIISATSSKLLESVKEPLYKKFKMKDVGELSRFLGTEFKCSETTVEMSQNHGNYVTPSCTSNCWNPNLCNDGY